MDMLAKAAALQDAIRARAGEAEKARRLPADLARALADAGMFRIMLPKSCGGLELDPMTALKVLEVLGEADASVGWCVMIGATTTLTAAYLEPDVARAMYERPGTIAGGAYAPSGRAVDEGGHYRLSGRWQWASGSANCRWLMGGSVILEDGKLRMLANGLADARMLMFPAEKAELIDTWNVAGLCGTGSGDISVSDLVVPKSHSVSIMTDRPRDPGALYVMPIFGLLAASIAAVMLGNARAAVADLVALAAKKSPQGSRRTLAERATAQSELAQAQARLHGAWAFLVEAVEAAWHEAKSNAEIKLATRAALRLAATHGTRTAAEVCRSMYDLGGGSSLFLSSPLQRRLRDAQAGTQHMMVGAATYELTGRVAMGLPTDATQL